MSEGSHASSTSPRILTIVQARLGSTRFPGKVLQPLGDGTVLSVMVERLRGAKRLGHLVVATTDVASDDPILAECRRLGVDTFRGHETDLLERHYRCWQQFPADAVVKIPSDCPLIDPAVIDEVLAAYASFGDADFVSNLHPQSWPDGNDVEVMAAPALERAWREAKQPHEREHTTAYLWDNPTQFRVRNVRWAKGLDLSKSHRWTLDYREDYELIKAVYESLVAEGPLFSVDRIVQLLAERPDIAAINARYLGDGWYLREAARLKTFGAEAHVKGA